MDKNEGNKHAHEVKVTVDTVKKEVRSGHYVVSEFKRAVGVEEARVLDQLINGDLVELKDDQRIEIEGGETFISHTREGKSS
jgi:hypothetical protein